MHNYDHTFTCTVVSVTTYREEGYPGGRDDPRTGDGLYVWIGEQSTLSGTPVSLDLHNARQQSEWLVYTCTHISVDYDLEECTGGMYRL